MEQYLVEIVAIIHGNVFYKLHGFNETSVTVTPLATFLLLYTPCEQTKPASFFSRITSQWRRFWFIASLGLSREAAQKEKNGHS